MLRKVYGELKKRNPSADDETLSYAAESVLGQMRGLSPDMRAQTNYLLQQAREEGRNDRADLSASTKKDVAETQVEGRKEVAGIQTDSREKVAAGNNATSRANTKDRVSVTARGQDIAHGDRAASLDQRTQAAAARIDASAASNTQKTAYKTLTAKRTQLTDAMKAETPGSTKWKALSDQKLAVDNDMIKLHQSAPSLPKPSEVVASTAAPAAPKAPPPGAPTATGPDGRKAYWDGKAWVHM